MAQNSIAPLSLVVIGGSAGSLEAILATLTHLRKDLPLAILIVIHRGSDPDPMLQFLLSSKTSLKVKEADEKELIEPGVIYIAPADYHLLIEKDYTFSLDFSEKINYSRPSIDVTFQMAADVFGHRLACILLSGGNADGSQGLETVKAAGGITAVQDPATSQVPYMPQHALNTVQIDHVLQASEMAAFINNLSFL